MNVKVEKWFGQHTTEYDNLSPEERREAIEHHVACIDKVVGVAMRNTITNYLSMVFIRTWGSDLEFVAELLEEKTRDQSYKLSPLSTPSGITGDPEIDSILARYSRPAGMGAA